MTYGESILVGNDGLLIILILLLQVLKSELFVCLFFRSHELYAEIGAFWI
jgi:hypothetical protein